MINFVIKLILNNYTYEIKMNNYLVFDVETNGIGGFRPPEQIVTQIAFIKFDIDGNILDQYSSIVKGATEINNSIPSVKFTLDDINAKGIDLKIAIQRFLDAIDDNTILVAHNAEFDGSIIKRDSKKYKLKIPHAQVFCTMKSSTNYCKIRNKYGYKWPSLNELATCMNIENNENNFHDAFYDCSITKDCFLKGLKEGIFNI